MVYYCDNETVDGVEFPAFPESLAPGPDGEGPIVIADMSSNILSRRIPVRNFSVLFFGAQKNLGCTAYRRRHQEEPPAAQHAPARARPAEGSSASPSDPSSSPTRPSPRTTALYNTLSIFKYVPTPEPTMKSPRTNHSVASTSPARS